MGYIVSLIFKALFSGIAALGFSLIFNVPKRSLMPIVFIAAVAGFFKFFLISKGLSLVWASFFAAIVVGIVSVPLARKWYAPPLVFGIPGIIPMIPGAFIYKMILGMIKIATNHAVVANDVVETIHNGMVGIFILIAISVGVGLPVIISRRQIMTEIEKHQD